MKICRHTNRECDRPGFCDATNECALSKVYSFMTQSPSPDCWDEAEKEMKEIQEEIDRIFCANDVIHYLRQHYTLIRKTK